MRIVKDRNKETLQSITKMYVKPESVIITEIRKELERMDYDYFTVNHSETYVDSKTGAHTNTIEGT